VFLVQGDCKNGLVENGLQPRGLNLFFCICVLQHMQNMKN